ncbi:MAG TPA: Asp-tRNA(Asn)/Glu-tRNA(Gln) amidotransferase subunit GatC [Candidatus Megaira endosymbiont of Hartmannula sinica]|nr:Asp-tRNA(Asn)/Glu-tRNA(Gln) amidotransferase subunit GatC [Candidatus Megaera endosymbiont of Hartmannula sinica]
MITDLELKKISQLAKLEYTDKERTLLLQKIHNVVMEIDKLKKLTLDDVEPLRSVVENYCSTREDSINEENTNITQQLFANSPKNIKEYANKINCFVVPKVLN